VLQPPWVSGGCPTVLSGARGILRTPIPRYKFDDALSGMIQQRASTSASQAYGSTSLSLAVAMRSRWLRRAGRPHRVLHLARTGPVVSSAWMRSATKT
jgi:hypothetical protein